MNIITLIRKHKATSVNDLLPILQSFDRKITTTSIHLALVALFSNHYLNLNTKRLYELMRWVNKRYAELPSTSNVETNLSKIRQVVKATFGAESEHYKKSQTHLVFDPIQKKLNIQEYQKKVFDRNSQCLPIKVSLINKLLAYNNSTDYKQQIIYLLINSGARYHELFTGLWAIDTENEHNLVMSNISKTKTEKIKIERYRDRF